MSEHAPAAEQWQALADHHARRALALEDDLARARRAANECQAEADRLRQVSSEPAQ